METASGFAVLDVETTGLFPERGDRVIEVAVIRTSPAGEVIDEWTSLVNPGRAVAATHVHGLTTRDVRSAPTFGDILGELNERLSGRALVAHNVTFDLAFLELEYARAGWEIPNAPYLCTLEASSTYLPNKSGRRLSACCHAVGIPLVDAHSALGDARATAALLRHYMDEGTGIAPLDVHLRLPTAAGRVSWPTIPRSLQAVAVPRSSGFTGVSPAAPGTIARLAADLPLGGERLGNRLGVSGYSELLSWVFEDGILTDAEACELIEFAKRYSLSREDLDTIHREFLVGMAQRAVRDGKVTRDERRELLETAEALGQTSRVVKAVLAEARSLLDAQRSASSLRLPETWTLGEPLRIGDGVVFTGGQEIERARLEGRAQDVGLRVTGSVSKKTVALVASGPNETTTKARRARELGTRVVSPAAFAVMVEYVQPADYIWPGESDTEDQQGDTEQQRDTDSPIDSDERINDAARCIRAIQLANTGMEFFGEDGETNAYRELATENAERLASLPRSIVAAAERIVEVEEVGEAEARRQCEGEESAFDAEWETIEQARKDYHSRLQAERKAGRIGTLTEIGRGLGLSAIAVGRILDKHGLRERIDVRVEGVPEEMQMKESVCPPLFGARYVPVEGGPLHIIRGVVEGLAVRDPVDGRDYWIAGKVSPYLEG